MSPLILLVTIARFGLAVFFILRGSRGTLDPSSPYCRRCSYELRQVMVAGSENCPECGARLAQLVDLLPPGESRVASGRFRLAVGGLGLQVAKDDSGRLTLALLRSAFTEQIRDHYCFDVVAVLGQDEIPLGWMAGGGGSDR